MGTSSDEEARATQDMEEAEIDVNLGDVGLPSWGDKDLRLAAGQADRERAITCPLSGWRNFARLFGDNIGAHLARDVCSLRPIRNLGPKTAYERQPRRDSISTALSEAGAIRADQRDFWTLSGGGQAEQPLPNSFF